MEMAGGGNATAAIRYLESFIAYAACVNDEEPKEAEPRARRRGRWNEHVYDAAAACTAVIVAGFIAFVLFVIGRWIAHVTGVWPL